MQLMRLEDQLSTLVATRKSLNHRIYRQSQLQRTQQIATNSHTNEELSRINEEVAAIVRIRNMYLNYIDSKHQELEGLKIHQGSRDHNLSFSELTVC